MYSPVCVTSTVRCIPIPNLVPGTGPRPRPISSSIPGSGGRSVNCSWLERSDELRSPADCGWRWLCTVVTVTANLSGRKRRWTSLSKEPSRSRGALAEPLLYDDGSCDLEKQRRKSGRSVARLPADIPSPVSMFDHTAMLTVA